MKKKIVYTMTVKQLSGADVNRKLSELEAKYGMTSREFAKKWNGGELDCAIMDYFDWEFYCEAAASDGGDDLRITGQGAKELKI